MGIWDIVGDSVLADMILMLHPQSPQYKILDRYKCIAVKEDEEEP